MKKKIDRKGCDSMKTPRSVQDFVTMLLINDFNMLTVELRRAIVRIDDEDKRLPVIEITFKDIKKSNWFNSLNCKLKEFLKGQEFLITNGDENNMFIILLQYELVIN